MGRRGRDLRDRDSRRPDAGPERQGDRRVLAPDGVLLWINQLGEDGPLYLPADDVAAALPGQWQAVEAHAGWGSWAALRRRAL